MAHGGKLVLGRFDGEAVIVITPTGERLRIAVEEIQRDRKVKLSFQDDPPRHFTIQREEIADA